MKWKLTVFLSFVLGAIQAQQRPHYTQYILNNYVINPAIAGIENYWDIKLSHRHQWVGLDGAPVTTYMTIQGPLRKNDYGRETATSFNAPGENPRGQNYWQNYESTDPHAGIGFTLLNDRAGPLNRFSASATYAYHLPVSEKMSLSAGVSAGIQNLSLNSGKLDFGSENPVDPAVAGNGYLNRLLPDINAGLWLYSNNMFLGLAAQNILPSKLVYSEKSVHLQNGKLIPHLFLTGGYRFFLNEDISMLPSFMAKFIAPLPLSFDLNTKFQYRDILWTGASYRQNEGFAAMFGVNISNSFNLSYSYDFITSKINTVPGASHEIMIGFLIGNRFGDWCPRNIW